MPFPIPTLYKLDSYLVFNKAAIFGTPFAIYQQISLPQNEENIPFSCFVLPGSCGVHQT